MPGQVTIRPIDNKGDLKKFVALPYRLYKDDPNFVPPLKGDALKKLIPGKNGWLSHAKQQLFLAERDGKVVGRISAHIDTLALEMPADVKLRGGTGKYAVRAAVAPWLPDGILDRRKQGFQMPVGEWFRGDLDGFAQELWRDSGVALTDFLLCPHAPGPRDMPKCLCRKPAPGMLVRAARRHRIDLARSWMVGDTLDDVEAGRRAGCRGILFDSGRETRWRRSPLRTPHQVCRDWREVTREVLQGGLPPQVSDPSAGKSPGAAHRLAAAACP